MILYSFILLISTCFSFWPWMILLRALFNDGVNVIFVEAVLSAWKDDVLSSIYAISQLSWKFLPSCFCATSINLFRFGSCAMSPESDQLTSFFWGHMREFESYLVALEDSQPWEDKTMRLGNCLSFTWCCVFS